MSTAARRILLGHLVSADSGWSMGAPGAVAEFIRTPDEPTTIGPDQVVTAHGGIRLDLPTDLLLVAHETPAGPRDHWNHTLALCVPRSGPARTVITELGPDADPLRESDRDFPLIDLGLGLPAVDACVRVTDPDLVARLREAAGTSLFEDPQLIAATVANGPHRVFTTACGRVEVYTPIPTAGGRSPDGPHTHLLPNLLRGGRTHPATAPIPDGYLPVAACHPAHPTVDRTGMPRPWDQAAHEAFADLLEQFGDPEQRRLTEATRTAVLMGDALPNPTSAPGRAAVAVALRRIARTEPELAGTIAAIRGRGIEDVFRAEEPHPEH